jgi:acetylglutamate kinase
MIVIKYGGHAMVNDELAQSFAHDVVALSNSGEKVVVVHGGGPQIDEELKAKGLTSSSIAGLRVTTPEMMNVVEMVLSGRVLRDVTNSLIQAGGKAVGITGRDAQLLVAKQITKSATGEEINVGQVGEIVDVNPQILHVLMDAKFIPVIAPVSADEAGRAFNVNADSAAGAIAGALQVDRTLFLTDVPGLLRKWPDQSTLISNISYAEAQSLLPTLSDGMIPKVAACLRAIEMGAKSAQIVDGREKGAVQSAIGNNSGTVFTA